MKRFRIGRIDVAMRGIAPAAARAAAQELGAAIVRQIRADEKHADKRRDRFGQATDETQMDTDSDSRRHRRVTGECDRTRRSGGASGRAAD